jgi:hypothetical protein
MGIASTIVKNLASETAPTFGKFVEEQPGLFSKLADVVRGTNFGKMDSRQLNKTLLNKGVTVDEVGDTLGGLSGTVSRQQVVDRIGERGIKTEDVVLGAPERTLNPVSAETLDSKFEEFFKDAYDNLKSVGTYSDLEAQQFAQEQARHNIMRWKDINHPTELTKPTHYSTWVAPGAKEGSYREMFVTAPSVGKDDKYLQFTKGLQDIDNMMLPARERIASQQRLQEHLGITDELATDYMSNDIKGQWKDGHTPYNNIQNPIVRIRFNDRIIGGNSVAENRLEEVKKQMDGMLEGKGNTESLATYDTPEWTQLVSEYNKLQGSKSLDLGKKKILFVEEIQGPQGDQKYSFLGPNTDGSKWGSTVHKFDTKEEALLAAKKFGVPPTAVEKVIEGEQGKMPPALQERIYDIGVKRILAYAKENGYDGVAWTPGKMQADRYSLAKQLDTVQVSKFGYKDNYHYQINGLKGGERVIQQDVPKEKLADTVGKTLAAKIIVDTDKQEIGSFIKYEGLDLEIGGEGLKSLYDVRIPSLFKKYGKAEVGELDLSHSVAPGEGEVFSQHFKKKLENMKVPFIPITRQTPSRYPIYGLAPLTALGIGANQFGPQYFKDNQTAQPRGF